ncbi:Fic family protein [Candidatus Micrarchaeota archaeon]|nr:Fic family protein [Candidatus Micrarchaeota archaeon]
MVSVKKRVIKGKSYYYVEHSFRQGGSVRKKEAYIGRTPPKNVGALKQRLLSETYREKWFRLFDDIKQNFSKAQRLMPRSAREKEMKSFSTRFTYDSQRIEGSKLTLLETAELLEHGIVPRARLLRDIKETESHEKVFYQMISCKEGLSLPLVLRWHEQIFRETNSDIAGKLRGHDVTVIGSQAAFPKPRELEDQLGDFFKWYRRNGPKIHPVELSALVHLKFVTIHPFADGNGRISRLLMNFSLNQHGYPMLDITYANRIGYYRALERSQLSCDDHFFLNWFFKRYIKQNKNYLPR